MKNHMYANRKDKECPKCFAKEYAYQGLFFRTTENDVCYECYYKNYATPEEIIEQQKIIDELPF